MSVLLILSVGITFLKFSILCCFMFHVRGINGWRTNCVLSKESFINLVDYVNGNFHLGAL